MRLFCVPGNTQRLDGGAMYGNCPKAVWSRWSVPDEQNRITLACRALLLELNGRWVLFEAGIGAYMAPALRERFGVLQGTHVLLKSLAALGLSHEKIDDVVISHLHFDHVGGLLSSWVAEQTPHLLFPNATFYVGAEAWERACLPHARDRASFIPELNSQLEASGRLRIVQHATDHSLGDSIRFRFSSGHTPGLMHLELGLPQPIVFASDLIPGVSWVHLPITMGYDRYPERLIEEKEHLLNALLRNKGRIFFTHDPQVVMGEVARDAQGRFKVVSTVLDSGPGELLL